MIAARTRRRTVTRNVPVPSAEAATDMLARAEELAYSDRDITLLREILARGTETAVAGINGSSPPTREGVTTTTVNSPLQEKT
jgi:hypothetical protein